MRFIFSFFSGSGRQMAKASVNAATAKGVKATKAVKGQRGELSAESAGGTPVAISIEERAYYKWEASGRPSGDGVDFWLEAENECRSESAS